LLFAVAAKREFGDQAMSELTGLLKSIYTIFLSSPSKGILTFLIAWVVICWAYKFVIMGRSMSFTEIILRPFSVRLSDKLDLTTLNSSELAINSAHFDGEHKWTLSDVYLAYWSVVAKRHLLFAVTVITLISTTSLSIMHLAGPKDLISLNNVIEILSYFLFLPCVFLFALVSFGKMLGSAHKVPSKFNDKQNGLLVILFGW
jgi:hypothetical protein